MFCDKCDVALEWREATKGAPYLYEMGGGWHLSGIRVYRCPKCGLESPMLPRLTQLHALMAETIADKPTQLTGPEVRVLRKHAGFSAKRFANLVGLTPSYLSRVENNKPGHQKFGAAADRLARLLVSETESAKQALMRIADEAAKRKPKAAAPPRNLRLVGGRTWKPAA
jgi:transcriptional regulator with XRE-family HTH domain